MSNQAIVESPGRFGRPAKKSISQLIQGAKALILRSRTLLTTSFRCAILDDILRFVQQIMHKRPIFESASPSHLQGLSEPEVLARRAEGLGNMVKLETSRTYGQILRENLLTFFNLVLFGIGLGFLLLGSPGDAVITSGVGLLNVLIAVEQEIRAKRKLDQIALLTRPRATVIREGREQTIDPGEVVLGDVLVVGPGDQVVTDGTVVGDGHMDVDESLLTGEADPVPKKAGDPVFSGSFCVVGRAAYEATQVGAESLANQLAKGARTFTRECTPLQREVDLFVRVLLAIIAFFGILLAISTFVRHDVSLLEAVRQASVVMGIAPSSMFLMIVVAYALGALRIADKGALVQQANSVESLCNVTVLCLDKTGTLTANRIQLDTIDSLSTEPNGHEGQIENILGSYARSTSASNRTTDALAASCAGQARATREEVPFSSARKWSALAFDDDDLSGLYVLGAPEVLMPYLSGDAVYRTRSGQTWEDCAAEWTAHGLRVVLFAYYPKVMSLAEIDGEPHLSQGLIPLCLLSFRDELRAEAGQTLDKFRKVGIEIKILSGDHPDTVVALAKQAGLMTATESVKAIAGPDLDQMDDDQLARTAGETTIFGRITPQQKERLVRALRSQGQYVAMTGDGVNDVLALKQANLGIAMQSGSQAARTVSAIVLLNDSFAVLPEAFAEGQRIVNGMTDILKLYMTRVLSLALLITAIAMLGAGFPFSATQSSLISLLTLSVPALGLALWARPGSVSTNLTRRLMHFVIPAVIVTGSAGLIVYLYFFVKTAGDTVYAQQALTYAMIAMGLLLIVFVEPPTRIWAGGDTLAGDWRPSVLVVGLFAGFVVLLMTPSLRALYGMAPLQSPTDYIILVLLTVAWALGLRYTWRARLVDRYLNVDLEGGDQAGPRC
jgi:cation-transporting ATPase E